MGVVQRTSNFADQPGDFVHRERPLPGKPFPETLAFDQRHDIVQLPLGRSRVEEWQDMRMLEFGGGVDLGKETLGADRSGKFRQKHLNGYRAVMADILGTIDRGHAPAAQFPLQDVATQ
jgi:hypothetical protein